MTVAKHHVSSEAIAKHHVSSEAVAKHHVSSEAAWAAVQTAVATVDEKEAKQLAAKCGAMVAEMRATFRSGRTRNLSWRRKQLSALMRGIQESHERIAVAVLQDLGGAKTRAIFDMGTAIGDIEHALANLEQWVAPATVKNDLIVDFQSTYTVRPEPKGVTLNIAPWNFPVILSFQPLVPALAAGNCMVIKPSEMSPHCAEVIEYIVNTYLDTDCVKVLQGAVAETTALLEQHWDHIFYTGNGAVGRIVMQAAAKHLTPVTLELGGKSPVLVDKTADMAAVVNRIFFMKALNCGQICVAPDYVVIDESRSEEFLREFIKQVNSSGFAEHSKENQNWGAIVNSRHVERLIRLIRTSGGEILCGGAEQADAAARHVPLTVIKSPAPDAPVLHEEIFGPVLPVIPVKSMDEGIKMVRERELPLALYVFSRDKAFQERVLNECDSGGASVNTCSEQLLNKEAPFGGIGASGLGQYHGKAGFDTFSHPRTVLFKSGRQAALPPPEQQPAWLYDVALKFYVTGFLSPTTAASKRKFKTALALVLALVVAVLQRRLRHWF